MALWWRDRLRVGRYPSLAGRLVQLRVGRLQRVIAAVVAVAVLASVLTLVAGVVSPAPASAAPGTPGVPQAATQLYREDFENTGQTPIPITSYTGVDGQTYTADAPWRDTNQCNGIVLRGDSPDLPGSCNFLNNGFSQDARNGIRQLASALGGINGRGTTNHAVSEYTEGDPGANLVELQTVRPVPLAATVNNRFVSFGVNVAAINCYKPGPLLNFFLVNGTTETSVGGTPINPCTDSRSQNISNGKAGSYTSNGGIIFTGSSLGVRLRNANGSGNGNDHAIDDLRVVDSTPQLDVAFPQGTQNTGSPVPLTFTITNTSELGQKPGFSFNDTLPAGYTVASPTAPGSAAPTTTCTSGVATAPTGGTTVNLTGGLAQGQTSCTVTVYVTTTNAGTGTTGPGNVATVGLNAPGSSSTTVVQPPVANPDTAATPLNTAVTLNPAANDTPGPAGSAIVANSVRLLDATNTPVTTLTVANQGTYTVNTTTGAVVFTPVTGYTGVTTPVNYRVAAADGGTATSTITVSVNPPPQFNANSKTVTDVSGNNPAQPGDTLEYSVTFTNSGQDAADNAVVRDVLPANTSFLPGTLRRVANPGQTGSLTVSDPAGDDVGEYDAASRTVRVRVGTGSSATAGGTLAANQSTTVSFRVTVDRAAAGTTVTNTPLLDYRARTLAQNLTFTGNAVSTPVAALADLRATKTGNPTAQAAGGTVTYTVGATNAGPNATGRTTLVDTLPAGLTFVSAAPPTGTTCSVSGQTVTCVGGGLANGASLTVPIVARVAAATAAGSVTNSVAVSSDLADDVGSNNTASAPTQVTRSADLGVTTAIAPNPVVPGTNATLTSTVTNTGPSTADGVTITFPVPAGTTYVSATVPGGTCAVAGSTVTCRLTASLAPGATATVTGVVAIGAAYTAATLPHTATVSSSTDDPATGNNTSATSVPTSPATDLVINFAPPAQLVAGNRYTYTGTVTNNGPSDAQNVVVTPTGANQLTFVNVATSVGSCTITGATPSCNFGTVPAGATVTNTITIDVPSSLAAGASQTLGGTVSTPTRETNTANNAVSSTLPVVRSSDLKVAINPNNGSPVLAGQPTSYTVTATNVGPSNSDATTFSTTLPAGLTPTAATFPGGTCGINGQTVTCNPGVLTPNQAVTATITANVAPNYAQQTATVTAAVSGASPDPVQANNTASGTFGVAQAAYLALTNTVDKNPVSAGDVLTYTYTYVNTGPSVANNVTITDDFGAGNVVVPGGTCTGATGGPTVTCALGALAPNTTGTVTVTVRVDPNRAVGPLTDNASLQASDPVDPNLSNNSAQATTQVVANADLATTITRQGTDPVAAGSGPVTYTATLTNNGPSAAPGSSLAVDLPAGATAVSATIGTTACTISGSRVTCPAGTVAVGTTATATLRVTISPTTPAGPVTLVSTVSSSVPDAVAGNNRATVDTPVTTVADLTSTTAADPASLVNGNLVAGARATFRSVVTNNGPSDAQGTTFTTTLPAGTAIVSATPSTGTCTTAGQVVTCSPGTVPTGSTVTLVVVVDVAPTATGPLAVTTAPTSQTPDPNTGNNNSTASFPVARSADLSITLAGSPAPVTAGTAVTYTATVTNSGPSVADQTTASIALPAGLTVAAGGVSAPAGVTCTPNAAGTAVDCTLGTVAAGGSATIVVRSVIPAGAPAGSLTATATTASPTPDPDLPDRTATTTTTVTTAADLAVSIDPGTASPTAGGTQTYNVTARNLGPSNATAATVTTTLPAGVTATGATTSTGAACTVAGSTVTCPLGTLAPGALVTETVSVTIGPAFTGPLSVTAAIASGGGGTPGTPDPVTTNNQATTTQTVASSADLAATAAFTGPAPVAGQNATYRFGVTNTGPSVAGAVTVGGPLPAGTTLVSVTPSAGGTCTANAVACTFGTLGVGASAFVDVTVAVAPTTLGPVSTTNTVGTSSTDTFAGNNTATATAPVASRADLAVTSNLVSGTPTAGQEVRYQVVVRNNGPSAARGVRLTNPAPAGLRITGSAVAAGAGTCQATPSGLDCTLTDIPVGGQTVVTVIGILGDDVTNTVTTTSTVSSTGSTDPVAANDSTSLPIDVGTTADVGVTVTPQTDPVVPGAPASWQLGVTNTGPSVARGVVVTDTLPAGLTITAVDAGPGRTCTTTATTAECSLGDLASGAFVSVTVTATVSPGYIAGSVRDDATVRSSTADTNSVNNTASATTPTAPRADLTTVVTGPATAATAGGPVTFGVRVSNLGPSDAAGATASTTLPPGLLNVVVTSPTGTCTVANGVATCPLGVVPAGGNVAITVSGTVDPTFTGPSLIVGSTATSTTPDPVGTNNAGSATTPVGVASDVSVTQTVAPTPATPGADVAWTSTVRNAGPSTATGVTFTDTLPDGLTNVRVSTAGAPCTVAGATVTCPIGTLAPGATAIITVTALVDPARGADAPLVNTVAVTSTSPDPGTVNNSATSSTPVAPAADLSVGAAITSGDPIAGAPATFQVQVRNLGPSTATASVVDIPIPDGFTLNPASVTPAGTCAVEGTVLRCRLGTLAPGADLTITASGTLAQGFGQTFTVAASVASPTTDPDQRNNTSSTSRTVGDSADLAITASPPLDVIAGQPFSGPITITNNGPSAARNVIFRGPPIPPEVLAVAFTGLPPGATCASTPTEVVCQLGTLAPNGSFTFSLNGAIDPATPPGQRVNPLRVSSDTPDSDARNNVVDTTVNVTTQADLAVGVALAPATIVAGNGGLLTLTVTNNGLSAAGGVVSTDALPAGLELAGPATGPGATCRTVGRAVSCDLAVLAPGASTQVQVPVRATPSATGPLTVNATVVSGVDDPQPGNNTASATANVDPRADLTVALAGPARATAGQPLEFTATVSSAGPSDAQNVVLTQQLPAGLDGLSVVPSQGTCTVNGLTLTCSFGTVGAGTTAQIVVRSSGTLSPDATGSLTTTATLTSPTLEPDPAAGQPAPPAGRDATLTVPVDTAADVEVTISGPTTPVPGQQVAYTLGARNLGPSTARGTVLAFTAPPGVTGLVFTPPPGVTCDAGSGRCVVGDLRPGTDPFLITVTGVLAPTATGPTTAAVTATSTTTDPDPGDNTASTSAAAAPSSDVAVTQTVGPAPLVAGGPVTWTLTVTNNGPSTATGVVVDDQAPAGVTGVVVTGPAGVTCTATTCTLPDLAPGAANAVTLTVTGRLPADATGSVTNTATVDTTSTDPVPDNDTTTLTTPVTGAAALATTVTGPAQPAVAGSPVRFTVDVASTGPSAALGTVVTIPVPAGVTGLTGTTPGGTCALEPGGLVCRLGTVAPGTTPRIVVDGLVDPNATGPVTLTATATSNTPDAIPADDTGSASTPVTRTADLGVTLTASGPLVPGQPASVTVTVTNAGPSASADTATTLRLPPGVVAGMLPAGCTATGDPATGQTVTCAQGTVLPNAPVSVTIPVTVAPNAPANGTVTATVASSAIDPTPGNNTATLAGPGAPLADLGVTTAPVAAVTAGDPVTVTSTVVNNGPSTAPGASVAIRVPAGLTGATASTPAGPCGPVTAGTITCPLGDLAPNAAPVTVTLTGTTAADATGPLTVGVSVSSAANDTVAGNNTTSTPITVNPPAPTQADLSVTVTPAGPLTPGGTGSLQIVATNAGPATAPGATTTLRLPPGVTAGPLPAGCTATGGPAAGQTVTCALGDLAPNAPVTRTVPVTVAPNADPAAGPITATVGSTAPDPDTTDNTATTPGAATRQADLAVTTTPVPQTAAGAPVTVTSTVVNNGPSTAPAAAVTVVVPAGLANPVVSTPAGPCGPVTNGSVTCPLGDLAPGTPVTVTLTGTVAPDATGPLTVGISATSAATDPVPTNNATSTPIAVTPAPTEADLSVTVTPSGPLVPGQPGSYQIVATNAGPATAPGATATVRLPAGIAAGTLPPTCTVTGDPGTGQTVTCALGDLAPNAPATLTLPVTVAPNADPATGTTTVSVGSTAPDPDLTDNTATSAGAAAPQADVAVTTTPVPQTAAGQPVTVTSTVVNNGPSTAGATTVTVRVPAGLTAPVVTTSVGTCGPIAGDTVTCTLGDLALNAPVTVTLTGTVAPDATGPLTVAVSATTSANDPVAGNNTTSTPVPVTPAPTAADLGVTVTPSGPLTPGQPGSYQVTTTNAGPATARGATATLRLPAGMTVGTLPAGCTVAGDPATGQTVTCALGDVVTGTPVTRTIPVTVAAGADPAAGPATATVGSTAPDPNPNDNVVSAPGAGAPAVDLAVTTPAVPATTPGGPVTVTSTVVNNGPSTAPAASVTVTVPAGLVNPVVSTPAGPCGAVTNGSATCPLGALAPNTPVTVTLTGTVAPDATGPLTVGVSATSAATDTVPANDATSTTVAVTPPAPTNADLSVVATPSGTFTPGAGGSYGLVVTNDGPATARGATATVRLPVGITAGPLPAGCTATGDPAVGQTVTCALGDLPSGTSANRTIPVLVAPGIDPGAGSATVVVASSSPDPDTTDNTVTVPGATAPQADLVVTTPAVPAVAPGAPVTITSTVRNDGPSTAGMARVTVTLPAGLQNPQVTVGTTPCTVTGSTATCLLGSLAPGTSVTVTVTGTAAPDATGALTVGVSATSAANDPTPANNTTSTPVALTPAPASADLRVTTPPVPAVTPGSPVTVTSTVTNTGPSTATGSTVTVRVPAGITNPVVSTPGGVCGPIAGDTVTCTLGDLAPGATRTVTLTGTVAPTATGPLAVTVSATSQVADPAPGNNTTSTPITAGPASADLAVSTPAVGPVTPGGAVTVTSTVTNTGPSTATGSTVTVRVPAGITNPTVSTPGGVCGPIAGDTVTCTLGDLAPGATRTVTLTGTVAPTATGPLAVTVSATSQVADPVTANNTTSTPITVTVVPPAQADLTIVKTVVGPVVAGRDVSWDVTVINAGPAAATGVMLTDALPASVTNIRTGSESCSPTGQVLTCAIGTLAPNSAQTTGRTTVRVTGLLAADAPDSLVNAATVESPNDSTPTNNTSIASSTVTRQVGLSITKVADRREVPVGQTVTWTIRVANAGPSAALDAVVLDDLPGMGPSQNQANPDATVQVLGSTPTGGYNEATREFRLGVVQPGQSVTRTLSARVVTPGDLSNTASVTDDQETDSATSQGTGSDGTSAGGSVTGPGSSGDVPKVTADGTATSPDTSKKGLLAYTGVWILPVLGAAAVLLLLGGGLLLLARRRRTENS